jgi:hypothetical protein
VHPCVNSSTNDTEDIQGKDWGQQSLKRSSKVIQASPPIRAVDPMASRSSSIHWAKYSAMLTELVECDEGKPTPLVTGRTSPESLTIFVSMCAHGEPDHGR